MSTNSPATSSTAITPSPTTTLDTEKPLPATPVTQDGKAKSDSTRNALLRDAIIGFSDGLTVPFALCAALTTLNSSRVVISGGLAELFAGSLSMGIGAVLASLNESTQYKVEEARVKSGEGVEVGDDVVVEMLGRYGVERGDAKRVAEGLRREEGMWVKFMMDHDLKLTKPSTKTAPLEGFVMGISYFFGGLLPMIPYFAIQHNVQLALYVSIAITAVVTLVFGWLKAQFIRASYLDRLKSALWTLLLCGVATGVSYGIVWGIDRHWK